MWVDPKMINALLENSMDERERKLTKNDKLIPQETKYKISLTKRMFGDRLGIFT